MEIDDAKRLLELQACITHLLDEFISLAETVSVPEERDSITRTAKNVAADCVCDIIRPITGQHPGLNSYGENNLAKQWWDEARRRKFREIAANQE